MTEFDNVQIYADPAGILAGARDLAAVATQLGPAVANLRAVALPARAFGGVGSSAAAERAWQSAAAMLVSSLSGTASRLDELSDKVSVSAGDYRRVDALVAEMYRRLHLEAEPSAAVGGTAGIPAAGTHPAAVHSWWNELTRADQANGTQLRRQAADQHPELIGPLDGVPAEYRDIANRQLLGRELDQQVAERQRLGLLRQQVTTIALADELDRQIKYTDAKINALHDLRDRLENPGDRPPAYLLQISAQDDGRAIVSIGNPDTARQVLTYVPGMTSDLPTAPRIVASMDAVASKLPAGTAAIMWLGYDAPDLSPEVASSRYAEAAAQPLHQFQEGLRVTHEGEESRNVLLAHSYGTTAYGYAAANLGLDADRVYLLGSIGTTQQSAYAFLGTDASEVFVTTSANDLAHLPPEVNNWFGPDPSDSSFNANQLPSDHQGGWRDSHTYYLHDPGVVGNIVDLLAGRTPAAPR